MIQDFKTFLKMNENFNDYSKEEIDLLDELKKRIFKLETGSSKWAIKIFNTEIHYSKFTKKPLFHGLDIDLSKHPNLNDEINGYYFRNDFLFTPIDSLDIDIKKDFNLFIKELNKLPKYLIYANSNQISKMLNLILNNNKKYKISHLQKSYKNSDIMVVKDNENSLIIHIDYDGKMKIHDFENDEYLYGDEKKSIKIPKKVADYIKSQNLKFVNENPHNISIIRHDKNRFHDYTPDLI